MGEIAVESLTEDAMNRSRILTAAAMTAAVALFTGTLASGTEKVGKQEGLSCTVCHDKPARGRIVS